MRFVLALGLLVALTASANAARVHHAKSRHAIVRPSQAVIPSYISPSGARIYRDYFVMGGLRTDHDDPPATTTPPSLAAHDAAGIQLRSATPVGRRSSHNRPAAPRCRCGTTRMIATTRTKYSAIANEANLPTSLLLKMPSATSKSCAN